VTYSSSEYVSGGYYIVKAISRPTDLSPPVPDGLLTMSACFTDVMRDIVQLQWDRYEEVKEAIAEESRAFGIDSSQIPELVTWAKSQHNTNYLVFTHLEPALELHDRFVHDSSALVIGIGLHASLLASFEAQLTKDVNKGLGLAELIIEKRSLAEGGHELGFEPLGFEATKFHSWLCHNAPVEVNSRFGIRPNQLGLIDKFEDACRANEYLLATGAEPPIWEPWLLLDYTLTRN
jgi:hypothetical protein